VNSPSPSKRNALFAEENRRHRAENQRLLAEREILRKAEAGEIVLLSQVVRRFPMVPTLASTSLAVKMMSLQYTAAELRGTQDHG
jgi:hypothetical protein